MNGDVIKSFLVGLGFGVDDASLAKFNKAIASAGLRVAALYGSIKASAAGIFYSIAKISEGFEEMGYNLRLVAPAVNKMLYLRAAMLDAYRRAGIDLTKVVKQSILFNYSLAKTKFALEAVYKSVGARFLPMLTKQMDIFRAKIFANMPKIQASLEKFINFIFKAFEATTILGARVWSILGTIYDFFKKLDDATNGWSTIILGVVAAWKLLNLSFLASPLGMVIAGIVALIALFDDFKTQMEGGKSFFDWSSFIPVIEDIISLMKTLGTLVKDIFSGWDHPIDRLINIFKDLWNVLKGVGGLLGTVAGWTANLFSGQNAQPTLNAALQPAPLLPQSATANQRVSQETNIIVQGSADAQSTGKAVAGEQGKVNFDLIRNLKGATR